MDRRAFIGSLAGGLLAAPLATGAQPAGKVPRVGVLSGGSRSDPVPRGADAVQQGLIVMVANDPVAAGFVASVARPEGNITGLSMMTPEVVAKQLELLREVVPKISRVAVLGNPANPGNAPQMHAAETAARALGVRLQPLEARGPREIDSAFAAMTRERAGAFLVLLDPMLVTQREQIADLAAKGHLPAMYALRQHVEVGGCSDALPSSWTRFSKAPSPPTCPSNSRPSTSWSSTSKPPRLWA